VKHLSGNPLYGRLLPLNTNIRVGRKGMPGTFVIYEGGSEIA